MKNLEFKDFLFKTAVIAMACDGEVVESEIEELKTIVSNEVYFMDYDFEERLNLNIANIKANGIHAINQYLDDLNMINLTDHQQFIVIEVILRVIKADFNLQQNEIKFLQMVKARLKISEEKLIVRFPKDLDCLLDLDNLGSISEFVI
jgi:uncharacterized tellurite resistance protein B-like protein